MIYQFGSPSVDPSYLTNIAESTRDPAEVQNSNLALHADDSADLRLVRLQAEEIMNISGANVLLYIRTDNGDYDSTWDEDPNPTYWNPIPIKAFFRPQPLQAELNKWGVEVKNRTEVIFTHYSVFKELQERMIRPGDVLKLPYNAVNGPETYRVINGTPSGNFRYQWLYFTCQVETLTADITVRPEEDMSSHIIQESGGAYRETM